MIVWTSDKKNDKITSRTFGIFTTIPPPVSPPRWLVGTLKTIPIWQNTNRKSFKQLYNIWGWVNMGQFSYVYDKLQTFQKRLKQNLYQQLSLCECNSSKLSKVTIPIKHKPRIELVQYGQRTKQTLWHSQVINCNMHLWQQRANRAGIHYMYMHTASLLNIGYRHLYATVNSWLI